MDNENKKIERVGFIGLGNMGAAILEGFISKGALKAENAGVVSRSVSGRNLAEKHGVAVFQDVKELARFADMIILAVKPKDALAAIAGIKHELEDKALLSIVAGLNYRTIDEHLGNVNVRLMVTLPNTPVKVGQGVIAFTNETNFNETEKEFAVRIFSTVALVLWVSEKTLAPYAALLGSGPAFVSLFAESLADGAVLCGVPREAAYRIAAKTMLGTAALLLETGEHPGIIKDNVCSPAGTTIEGIAVLEKNAFRSSLIEAVRVTSDKFHHLVH
jgi:pyrroline-5-carboxylate reductase